jgi:hypothetical protein
MPQTLKDSWFMRECNKMGGDVHSEEGRVKYCEISAQKDDTSNGNLSCAIFQGSLTQAPLVNNNCLITPETLFAATCFTDGAIHMNQTNAGTTGSEVVITKEYDGSSTTVCRPKMVGGTPDRTLESHGRHKLFGIF